MKKKRQYIRAARTDDRYMPNTQRQGWGRLRGKQTESIEYVDSNGSRVIYRTSAFIEYQSRVEGLGGIYENSECGKIAFAKIMNI